ncbi:MAG: hypothetical protein KDK91_02745 [Gammaproteobacteria bacterium]|nr:hypothetical protein [Gammaproteobacteria bacterium]
MHPRLRLPLLALSLLAMSQTVCHAQQKAVTDTGEEIILYKNGTWSYVDANKAPPPVEVNPTRFEKPESASFLLKSSNIGMGVWLDPKQWKFKKGKPGDAAEYNLVNGELYGILITEQVPIPMESWPEIALQNGREAAPDARIVKQEKRSVNGLDVLHMRIDATVSGIAISYFGYYYSGAEGSVQFLAYTGQNLLEQNIPAVESLLNGLVALP